MNNDDFMHNKSYFLFNYRTHYCDDSANQCNYLRNLKSNKTAHDNLIAAQKFKNIYKFVRFGKEIFDKDNFDKFLLNANF